MKKHLAALGAIAAAGAVAVPAYAVYYGGGPVPSTTAQSSTAQVKKSVVVYKTSGVVSYSDTATVLLPGQSDPQYAQPLTDASACNGNVRVTVYRNKKKINRKTVSLKSNCSFKTQNTVSRNKAYGNTVVRVAYLGGVYLAPSTAPSKSFQIKKK